jgi:uncharacterized protein YkwD
MVGMTGAHNAVRAAAPATPRLPPIAWSKDLAEVAQSYAERLAEGCSLIHSNGPYGENLAYLGEQHALAAAVVDLWAAEKSCYTYGPFESGDRCTPACVDSDGCGHYTQIVWRATRVIGCGVATCAADDASEIWVCNYDPAGNVVGEEPY